MWLLMRESCGSERVGDDGVVRAEVVRIEVGRG